MPLHDDALGIADGPFQPTFDSLRRFECPDWFRDAKLAFWSHWGPQSVPMFGDWYARNMYMEGSDQYRQHWRVYGHPSKSGYKDLIPLWKAERFDPKGLMKLYAAAGAKYFLGQAMHHDNFDNFDSPHNPWNSVAMGPKKDISMMWCEAARECGLRFGLSEHLGASFNWFETNKGADKSGPYAGVPYDGTDPAFANLYYRNQGYPLSKDGSWNWYTTNEEFQRHWFARIKSVIDIFQPDLLYSDGGVPFGDIGLKMVAHLYNSSAALHGVNQAVYTQKDTDPAVYWIGVLDIERGQLEEAAPRAWQTDTSVGDWFYNVKDVYKPPRQVIESLVDIVSKNGNLALNIPQLPDGTIDDECDFLLRRMAHWMASEAEGIFGSRPWKVAGEGPTAAAAGAFKEEAAKWTPEDFRFTSKGDAIYAYQMQPSESGAAAIETLALGKSRRVAEVRALVSGPVRFEQTDRALQVAALPPAFVDAPRGLAIRFE